MLTPSIPKCASLAILDLVTRIDDLFGRYKLLLNRPHANKSRQQPHATSFIVGPACSCSTKRLLSNNGTSRFAV